MRISELSRRSGVPVATVKYYLREGLLPKGEATAATQAVYGAVHLRRLRLVRALVEGGDVPLAKVRVILDAIDDTGLDLHYLLGTVQYALTPESRPSDSPEWREAEQRTDDLLARLGWQVAPVSPTRQQLTQAIATVTGLGFDVSPRLLDTYAHSARTAADHDLAQIDPAASREQAVEHVAVITILMDQILVALHALAQENASAHRFGDGDSECGPE